MDTDFMNFSSEEYFSTTFLDSGAEDSRSYDDGNNYNTWEWEQEKEINGDVALIPVSSHFDTDITNLSTSPPSKEDFQKLICDWQQFINVDAPVNIDSFMSNDDQSTYHDPALESAACKGTFDITSYINDTTAEPSTSAPEETPPPPPNPPKEKRPRTGGKKIDMKAQRYVIDDLEDDHVDVETVSENGNPPVLEAGDLDSLLEQFEASEELHSAINADNEARGDVGKVVHRVEQKTEIVQVEKRGFMPKKQDVEKEKPQKASPARNQSEPEPPSSDASKSKQILEALPQELILRIKESGKRKPISVIPPIPNKKRCGPRMQEASAQMARNKLLQLVSSEAVQLDHDYCSSPSPYPKIPKKDSGFESGEEDERAVLRNQPTVKNADGKLMVSLLKVNTIKPSTSEVKQKRKLNLAEYKKRREFVVKSNESSQNNSPMNSSPNSPAVEDEVTRRKKHEEKLLQMSIDLLNTTPAKSGKPEAPKVPELPNIIPPAPTPPAPAAAVSIPDNMEVKTYLSVGTNTEAIPALPLCPEPVVEEIKPLLQNPKISTNSLIASVIENIPKVKSKNKGLLEEKAKPVINQAPEEHGENKTIVYLPKNRTRPQMQSVYVQTEPSEVEEHLKHQSRCSSSKFKNLEKKNRHRRKERSSSGSSRYSSSASYTSSSSRSTSRSRSRTRSRSPSPWQSRRKPRMDYERVQEVEERRVIYVGRLSPSMTRDDLRRRFQSFGPITSVSVHFRDHGDNYGFVTFLNKLDAYEAVEHGNDDPFYPKYDLSFGGRRMFCKTNYSDLDNMHEEIDYYHAPREDEYSFDSLLRKAQEKLRKRKL